MADDQIREQQLAVDGMAFRLRHDGMIVDRVRTLERALQEAKNALNVMLKQAGPEARLRAYNRGTRTIEIVMAEGWLKGEIAQIDRLFPPAAPPAPPEAKEA